MSVPEFLDVIYLTNCKQLTISQVYKGQFSWLPAIIYIPEAPGYLEKSMLGVQGFH